MRKLFVVLLMVSGCADPFNGECGPTVCVEWNQQPDQDEGKFEDFLAACERTIGADVDGARIVFLPKEAITTVCGPGTVECFKTADDIVYVVYTESLWISPVCHGLLHRVAWEESGDADEHHDDPRFAQFCGGKYLVCDEHARNPRLW